ncbi:hypothetical protein HHI36_010989 [Cryptolaemus montrouzieri]|uniref:Uncharacterized protein n=1 Tax=Cryptolaemus montrouzieri TaxID=559131 RepID=A0ABD2MKH0_9CUCU
MVIDTKGKEKKEEEEEEKYLTFNELRSFQNNQEDTYKSEPPEEWILIEKVGTLLNSLVDMTQLNESSNPPLIKFENSEDLKTVNNDNEIVTKIKAVQFEEDNTTLEYEDINVDRKIRYKGQSELF